MKQFQDSKRLAVRLASILKQKVFKKQFNFFKFKINPFEPSGLETKKIENKNWFFDGFVISLTLLSNKWLKAKLNAESSEGDKFGCDDAGLLTVLAFLVKVNGCCLSKK